MKSTALVLGIDVGGTALKAVAFDVARCEVVATDECPSDVQLGGAAVVERAAAIAKRWREQGMQFDRCGIACAGSVDTQHGVVRTSPNFPGWRDVALGQLGREQLQIPVSVENDANAAAVAEWKLGAGRGCRTMVLLTLGTGVGGGLVLEGRLYRGATGTAGELGHVTIVADGEPCTCGNIGCFERYCSASAIARAAGVSTEQVFAKPTEYAAVIERFERYLCHGMASLVNAFNPERLILGGAMSRALVPRLPALEKRTRSHAFPDAGEAMSLFVAELGTFAGAQGAALLAADVG